MSGKEFLVLTISTQSTNLIMKKIYQVIALIILGIILFINSTTIEAEYEQQIPINQEQEVESVFLDNNKVTAGISSHIMDLVAESAPVYISNYKTTIVTANNDAIKDENNLEIIAGEIKNETEEIVEEKQFVYPYTKEELETFAHLLYAEAGSEACCDTTIYYVGSVVLNRVHSKKYPDTLLEVIYQKGQYYPTWHGFMSNTPTERCYRIAKDLLENGSILPEEVLGQADYNIYKKYGSKLYAELDGEYFFYLK